jgi:hypothetical protein
LKILAFAFAARQLAALNIETVFHKFVQTVLCSRKSSELEDSPLRRSVGGAANDARKKLLIVTASGGTVPSASMYSRGISNAGDFDGNKQNPEIMENPKNAEVVRKGREISAQWKLLAQVKFLGKSLSQSNW